jgi:hypothetical protein
VVTTRTGHRGSVMSYEDPMSPTSSSGDADSISDMSEHSQDAQYRRELHENRLTPHLSRASSTSAIGGVLPTQLQRSRTAKSTATNATTDLAFEVDFDEGDPGNPQNWSLRYKALVIAVMSYSTTCVVLYSTSYTSAIPGLQKEWGIDDSTGILGVTTYLLGTYVLGRACLV